MLIRAHDLRSEITQFCENYSITYLLLNNDEWSQIEYLIDLLKLFCLFIKTLNSTRAFTINMIFKIYNRLFEHLAKTFHRLARKRVSWKKNLMKTIKAIQAKLIKYYSQTQSGLKLLYDKTVLLHSTVEDSLFHTFEWKIESEETSWHTIYWNALKEMYNEYRHQTSEDTSFNDRQTAMTSSSKTLNDLLNDDVDVQVSLNENEFNSYRRQDMLLLICFE
jgi:6-pyruvoyl-tetrahydropterin synthase